MNQPRGRSEILPNHAVDRAALQTYRPVSKLFQLLPVLEIELDMEDAWESQDAMERALASGNYIRRVRMVGCRQIYQYITANNNESGNTHQP